MIINDAVTDKYEYYFLSYPPGMLIFTNDRLIDDV